MDINVKITCPEIVEAINNLSTAILAGKTEVAPVVTAAPKKAATTATPKATPKPSADDETPKVETPKVETPKVETPKVEYTFEDVKKKLMALAKTNRAEVNQIIADSGATGLSVITPDKFNSVMAAADLVVVL